MKGASGPLTGAAIRFGMAKTYTTVTVFVHHFTDGAIKASNDGVEDNAEWCPRSCLEDWTPRLGTQDIDVEERKAGELGWT